jgi:hypothetical protein
MSNQVFKKNSQKIIDDVKMLGNSVKVLGDNERVLSDNEKVLGDSEKDQMKWLKSLCDKIKNIISRNGDMDMALEKDAGINMNTATNNTPRNSHNMSFNNRSD